jgi:ABC-type branched-subunit amino acid transport system permease subunit
MDLLLHLAIVIAIYTIFALSLNVEVGYTGLFNFGHVAFSPSVPTRRHC